MSDEFNSIEVDDKLIDAIHSQCETGHLLRVEPPMENDGMNEAIELFRSLHNLEVDGVLGDRMFKTNNSKVSGFEIWYDNEEIKFYYSTPDRVEEERYRRQLAGHYSGITIDERSLAREKFPDITQGEYISSHRLKLRHHYFEPIKSPESAAAEFDNDPYQNILASMDTKDENLRSIVQVLFKPAEEDWTELRHNNVESHAQKVKKRGGQKTRWYGMFLDDVDVPRDQKRGAKQIRSQVDQPGFYVNVRITTIADTPERAEAHMKTLATVYQNTYREVTKQQFVPEQYSEDSAEKEITELLLRKAARNGEYMQKPNNPIAYLRHRINSEFNTMIMTIPELSGLAHIPSGNKVDIDGISWTDAPVSGTLPPEAEKFSPTPKHEAGTEQQETSPRDAIEGQSEEESEGQAESDTETANDQDGDGLDPDDIANDSEVSFIEDYE